MVEDFVNLIVSFVKEHEAWAIPVAFFVAFAESFCFFSILWPGTAILVGIAALLAASGVEIGILWPAIVAAGVGGSLGYAISYWIGRYFKESVPRIWPFSTHPMLIPHGERFFEKYGAWGVFFGHFFGPVRAVIPVVAGLFDMRQLPFQVANIVSAFIWAGGVIAPAFFLVTFREQVVAFFQAHEFTIVAALFVLAYLNSLPMPLMAVPTLILFVGLALINLYAGNSPAMTFLASVAGAFTGDVHAYSNGSRSGRDLHTIWPNSWSPESGEQALAFISQRGNAGLFSSKFHTTLRSFAPLAAGALRTAFAPFVVVALLSSALWAGVLLAPYFVLDFLFG